MNLRSRERDFNRIGGLKEHVNVLKEMIIYPLLYKEVFESYGIEAPRGVLFHGPPGTGKTLTAGAVAAECSRSSNKRVSFYMQKGSDCLNKYVGESEKHLQNLFSQAYNTRPSIIFFDEIDGLVPTRSESQEVHASVVSTLLALMDGLDSKSEVFVIGATNRIDMIDPALRRPGRFDRELYFPLPSLESRIQIFHIHTRAWKHRPTPDLIYKLACECIGYCGADIQSLCTQAVMKSFHRHFPQVTDTSKKHPISLRNLKVDEEDFWKAKEAMVPASQRTHVIPSRPLTPELEPLLRQSLDGCMSRIQNTCPFKFLFHSREDYSKNKSLTCPRFLLISKAGQSHVQNIAPAVLHNFDHLPVTQVDLQSLNDKNIIQKLEEARQTMPSIVYFRDMSSWWNLIDESSRQVLVASVESFDICSNSQIFLFGTVNGATYEDLPSDVKKLFPKSKSFMVPEPAVEERTKFFSQLLTYKNIAPPELKQGMSTFAVDCEILGDLDSAGHPKKKRNIRQRRLKVESFGLMPAYKPRIGSYYRKYSYLAMTRPVGTDGDANSEPAESEGPVAKKPKKAMKKDASGSSKDPFWSIPSGKVPATANVDVKKLDELVRKAVEATASCSVSSIIRLYEELEIVTLRYTSKWDRSTLPQELEREISVFVPT